MGYRAKRDRLPTFCSPTSAIARSPQTLQTTVILSELEGPAVVLAVARFVPPPKPCKLVEHMDYAVIFEQTSTGWSAYVPDLPGLGVAGPTYEATEQLIREGINFHIEGLRADGDPIPEPTTRVARMPISA